MGKAMKAMVAAAGLPAFDDAEAWGRIGAWWRDQGEAEDGLEERIALIVSLLAAVLSPLASSSPDGLEKVAEDKGFIGLGQGAPFQVIADYVFPGIENEALATILAGIIGTLAIFGVVYGISWLIKSRRPEKTKNLTP